MAHVRVYAQTCQHPGRPADHALSLKLVTIEKQLSTDNDHDVALPLLELQRWLHSFSATDGGFFRAMDYDATGSHHHQETCGITSGPFQRGD